VLHFAATGRDAAFANIAKHIVTRTTPPPASSTDGGYAAPIVTLANALWAQQGATIEQAFAARIAKFYGAALKRVDFGSGAAVRTINDWVSTRTAGLIKKLFDGLAPSTKLVLANALYFKAGWEHPFSAPRPGTFTTPSGAKKAPLMSETEHLVWAQGDGWKAALVPYVGDELGMWVIVPTKGTAPGQVLTATTLDALAAATTRRSVRLTMPTWTSTTSLSLMPVLGRLGLTHLAGLSGIGPGLGVTDAVHKATITVTRDGTEAAAVTGVAVGTAAEQFNDIHVLRADHPFAYAIVDRQTNAPLFVGSVSDPTAR
jgi:serpin B